jgi:signal transduction histidine kinase
LPLQSKVLIFFAVLLLLIAFEWVFFDAFETRILREEMSERGSVLVRTLAQLAAEPLVAFRITRLENLVDSLLGEKDVLYARVYNAGHTVLAATDRNQEGWTFSGGLATDLEIRFEDRFVLSRAPIRAVGSLQGMAEIAFSLDTLAAKIGRSRVIFLTVFVGEILLALGFALFLQLQVVRPLGQLAGQVQAIRYDSLDEPLPTARLPARELRHLRRSLEQMREKLRAAQHEIVARTQLATMGRIAANISHEIRNPLEAISGAVEILSLEPSLGVDGRHSVTIIQEEIQTLNDYLSEFLELARPAPVRAAPAAINVLIEDCLLLLKPLLRKKHLRTELSLAEGLPLCTVDANQIKRVIVNLVLNSIDAMGEYGLLQVRTAAEDGAVEIRLADNGAGVREEHLGRLFDPYFTTKSGGSGIGLPLSRQIVEQHGGSIVLASSYGEGTVVTVRLPIPAEAGEAGRG